MSQYSVVGRRVPRVHAVQIATGAARFSGDLVLPRMLYGKLLRSCLAHARILHIDISRADVVQADGQVLSPDFISYAMPTAADAPRVKSIIVEAEDPNGPFGAKEAAETTNIAIVPCLASAVEEAVGGAAIKLAADSGKGPQGAGGTAPRTMLY